MWFSHSHLFGSFPITYWIKSSLWPGFQAFSWSNLILGLSLTITPKTLPFARLLCLSIHIYIFFLSKSPLYSSTNFYLSFKAQLWCYLYYKASSLTPQLELVFFIFFMSAKTRRHSVAWEHACRAAQDFFVALCMSTHDQESTSSFDFAVRNFGE